MENAKGELIIIEVQNTKEYDYFHRILNGTSKVITEYVKGSNKYATIKKVISITVAYFDLGQGQDKKFGVSLKVSPINNHPSTALRKCRLNASAQSSMPPNSCTMGAPWSKPFMSPAR